MDLLWLQVKEIWWMPLAFGINIFAFLYIGIWVRWLNLAASVVAGVGLLIIGFAMAHIYASGCYSAPKDVEFSQGMTICPGQTAHGSISLSDTQ